MQVQLRGIPPFSLDEIQRKDGIGAQKAIPYWMKSNEGMYIRAFWVPTSHSRWISSNEVRNLCL